MQSVHRASVCSLTKLNATNHIYRLQIASSTPVIPRSSASMSFSHLLHKIKRVSHLLFLGHESPEKSGGNIYIYLIYIYFYLCLELFVYTYMYLILIAYKASEDNPADFPCFQNDVFAGDESIARSQHHWWVSKVDVKQWLWRGNKIHGTHTAKFSYMIRKA